MPCHHRFLKTLMSAFPVAKTRFGLPRFLWLPQEWWTGKVNWEDSIQATSWCQDIGAVGGTQIPQQGQVRKHELQVCPCHWATVDSIVAVLETVWSSNPTSSPFSTTCGPWRMPGGLQQSGRSCMSGQPPLDMKSDSDCDRDDGPIDDGASSARTSRSSS